MKRWMLALLVVAAGLGAAEAAPLKVTAYVNITSGCQKPTEDLLRALATQYAGRIAVEVIDFGQPEGRRRWLGDGLHCMTILLDGSPKASIVFRGAPLTVSFLMPPGHNWQLEELETAVRQRLDGVADLDRKAPAISVKAAEGGTASVLAGESVILDNLAEAEAKRVATALETASGVKPLVQDDFALAVMTGVAKVSLRGTPLIDLGPIGTTAPADDGAKATTRYLRLIEPFARISRPFPGSSPRQPQP